MPEWHKGPVGPDKRHRKMAQIPTDTRVVRDTRATAATAVTMAAPTPPVSPPAPLTPMEADILYKAGIRALRAEYSPSEPPTLEATEGSSRSPSPAEPPLDRLRRALHTLHEAEVATAAAQAEVEAAAGVVARQRSTTPGKPS